MKSFDLFLKADAAYRKRTATGGVVTAVTLCIVSFLVLSETISYFQHTTVESIGVDRSFGEQLHIHVDIKFPNSACHAVNFDVVDTTGEEQLAVDDLKKKSFRNPDAKLKEGCHVKGDLKMNKVAGNFHFALGKGIPNTALGSSMSTDPFSKAMVGAQHQHRFDMFELRMFNASHEINHLSFGRAYPGMPKQPLDGVKKHVASGVGQYNYYVSVVPTTYTTVSGYKIKTCQYSYTQKVVEVKSTERRFPHPGVFIYLSISPLEIQITEVYKSFFHFITNLLAIIGSAYVISSFVDALAAKLGGCWTSGAATVHPQKTVN